MLEFLGYSVLAPQVSFGAARVHDSQRNAWLADWVRQLQAIEAESPIQVGPY